MATKFSVQKLFSLPLADKIITSPKLLPLSHFAKQSYNYFVSQYHTDRGYEDQRESSSLADWQQFRFHSFPVIQSDICQGASGQDSSRRIHYSAHVDNKDGGEGKSSTSNIKYAVIPKEKADVVSNFLIRFYHQQEPITVALGMPMKEVEGWFQRFIRKSMFVSFCDVSVQAVDEKRKKRVGVLTSMILDPKFSRPLQNDFTDPIRHPVNTQMNEFYDSLEEGLNPAEAIGLKMDGNFPCKLLEHLFISVHPDYANQGISNKMVELSESLASNVNNCRVGYTIATSEFSYATFLKNGYKVVRESRYADYTNSKGEKIFEGKEDKLKPHHTCRAMVKEIKPLY